MEKSKQPKQEREEFRELMGNLWASIPQTIREEMKGKRQKQREKIAMKYEPLKLLLFKAEEMGKDLEKMKLIDNPIEIRMSIRDEKNSFEIIINKKRAIITLKQDGKVVGKFNNHPLLIPKAKGEKPKPPLN